MTFWVYINDWYNNRWASICAKSNNSSRAQYGIEIGYDGITNFVNIDIFYEYVHIITNYQIQLSKWYFIAFTWNGNKVSFYINYIKIADVNFAPQGSLNTSSLEIGRHTPVATEYLSGKLDDIRIYNRVLTESEVQEIYHEGGYGQ